MSFSLIVLISVFTSIFATKIEPIGLQKDFDFMITLFKDAYIDPYGLVESEEFSNIVDSVKEKLDKPMNVFEFIKTVSPIFKYLKDYHCNISFPVLSDLQVLPMTLYVVDNEVYIVFSMVDDIPIKSKVLKIDEVSSKQIIEEFEKFVTIPENTSLKEYEISRYINLIPTIWDKKSLEIEFEYNGFIKRKRINAITMKEYKEKINELGKNRLPYEFERKGSTGVLKIYSFRFEGDLFADFREFLNKVFEENKDMTNLIIDIRRNFGGNSNNVSEVLGHFVNEKLFVERKTRVKNSKYNVQNLSNIGVRYDENSKGKIIEVNSPLIIVPREPVFKGKVWVLVDKGIASAATVFAGIVQKYGIGTIIGEKPIYSPNTTVKGIEHYLINIKTYVYIPGMYHIINSQSDEIIPDYEFIMTTEEKLEWLTANSDPFLDRVIEFIENN